MSKKVEKNNENLGKNNIFINYSILFIEKYQKYLSPDHSKLGKKKYPFGYCRYFPTCSDYTKLSLQKHGFVKGWIKGIYRILRCNPCSKGGVDNP